MQATGNAPSASSNVQDRDQGRDPVEAELFAWVAAACDGAIERCTQASGGNRCRAWAIDVRTGSGPVRKVFLRYGPPRPPSAEPYTVWREARVYRAIAASGVKAPALLAVHDRHQAILTERVAGRAEYRHLKDLAAKQSIAIELMQALAMLHRMPAQTVRLDAGDTGARIADHVRAELTIWRAMYAETNQTDPLLDFAFDWLDAHVPDPDGAPALVHGDAGPGNFMFDAGRLTALIDWELAHVGDPMEDLAWFSMRCVMEPVPDFAAALAAYAQAAALPVDEARVLYHRVFVSTRVVVIRHRNVTGEPANTIISKALNRRLLVEALADATGTRLPATPPLEVPPTSRSELYDNVLDDLKDVVAARSDDSSVIAAAKNAAKVLKHLRDVDRYGAAAAAAEIAALAAVLGTAPPSIESGHSSLSAKLACKAVPFEAALNYFAGQAARDAQLAAAASGGIASRHYPSLSRTERG